MSGLPERAKILNLRDTHEDAIGNDGARGTFGMPLLDLTEGTGQFDFRAVRIAPGGISADHAHPWEQANFILSGCGTVTLGETIREVAANDFVYVPPDLRHVFTNTGDDDLVLLAARGPRLS